MTNVPPELHLHTQLMQHFRCSLKTGKNAAAVVSVVGVADDDFNGDNDNYVWMSCCCCCCDIGFIYNM